jgi:hypothetical protein
VQSRVFRSLSALVRLAPAHKLDLASAALLAEAMGTK